MSFAEKRPTTGYCEFFEKDIKNVNKNPIHCLFF